MAAITLGAVISAAVGAVKWLDALVGEAWSRYFLIMFGLAIDTGVGNLTGIFPLEGIISFVVANIFNIPGFIIPVYYGVSSLLILVGISPVAFYLIKSTLFTH